MYYLLGAILLFLCSILVLPSHAFLAIHTIDNNNNLTSTQWQCLKNSNDQFKIALARIYDPRGSVDQSGVNDLTFALGNHLAMYAYISPCVTGNCQNGINTAAEQVNAAVNYVTNCCFDIPFYFFLIDVSKTNQWSSNQAQNQQFILDMLKALNDTNQNPNFGIMTSYNDWSSIVGGSFVQPYTPYLWWVNYNGRADLTTSWSPFGGFSSPLVHEYANGVTTNCATGITVNYGYSEKAPINIPRKDRRRDPNRIHRH